MEEYIIKAENTAIKTGVSTGTKYVNKNFENSNSVLDFGAGKLRNSLFLHDNGFKVDIYDIPEQINKLTVQNLSKIDTVYSKINEIEDSYDIVMCSFVINVIEDVNIRKDIIKNIEKFLKKDGHAIIEVRKKNFLKTAKTKIAYKDGYLLGNGRIKTFQKPYELNEIHKFIENNSNLKVLLEKQQGDSIFLDIKK